MHCILGDIQQQHYAHVFVRTLRLNNCRSQLLLRSNDVPRYAPDSREEAQALLLLLRTQNS